jgi:hypothetical protein
LWPTRLHFVAKSGNQDHDHSTIYKANQSVSKLSMLLRLTYVEAEADGVPGVDHVVDDDSVTAGNRNGQVPDGPVRPSNSF